MKPSVVVYYTCCQQSPTIFCCVSPEPSDIWGWKIELQGGALSHLRWRRRRWWSKIRIWRIRRLKMDLFVLTYEIRFCGDKLWEREKLWLDLLIFIRILKIYLEWAQKCDFVGINFHIFKKVYTNKLKWQISVEQMPGFGRRISACSKRDFNIMERTW